MVSEGIEQKYTQQPNFLRLSLLSMCVDGLQAEGEVIGGKKNVSQVAKIGSGSPKTLKGSKRV